MSQQQQLVPVEKYDPTKHDTTALNQVVFCPYTKVTMVLSDVNGCGVRCPHFMQMVPVVTNVTKPAEGNGKPVVEQQKIGDKVACTFPTLRDVVAVHAVVNAPMPPNVVPFPAGTPGAELKPPAPDAPPADPSTVSAEVQPPDPAAG